MSERSAEEPSAIFRRLPGPQGAKWIPSVLAQGPWDPRHLHGGAVCGVLGHAIEACESPVPMRVARMTIEMTRAVPLEPFHVSAEVTRSGKRIQQIDARIELDGKTLARASALRMRIADQSLAAYSDAAVSLGEPVPERTPTPRAGRDVSPVFFPGFINSLEFWRSRLPVPGEAGISWTRMRSAFVEGEQMSPFVRLATLCDFASGAGNPLDFHRYTSINPDVSLHVLREPRGEWIGLQGWTQIEADGIGQSHCTLYDDEGAIGRVLVSLLVERRPEAS